MNNEMISQLQFDQIKKEVQARAIGNYSKKRISKMTASSNLQTVLDRQEETREARLILESSQHVPFMGLPRIDALTEQVKKGLVLSPADLIEYADFLRSSRMITKFFDKNQYQAPLLFAYSKHLPDLINVEELIDQKIKNNKVSDDASRNLRKVRKQLQIIEKEIQSKLLKFLRHPKNKEMIQEAIIVQKGECYTIPIKASYKNKVDGTIIDESNKGTTVFIEPTVVSKLNEHYQLLKAEEISEEYQVLAALTGAIAENEEAIDLLIETMTVLDIIFARAKFSREINGITPKINKSEHIVIKQGRHPFLPDRAVPLDVEIGKKGSELAVFDEVFVDVGDHQNLENALSTFSGHMQNIAAILKKIKRNTLVLLDEIGSGTEPNEGAALAIAIMESMYEQGALIIATTHYGEIKKFARDHEDFVPAAMAFDREALRPKYQLRVGETGESQALWIAHKMAMSMKLIQQAERYLEEKAYRTQKKEFPPKTAGINRKDNKKERQLFAKGDRIFVNEYQKEALVYEDIGEDTIAVYLEKEMIRVPRQCVRLVRSAENLYPAGYDLDSLFIDFKTRKQQRDLERGSKKAHKALVKEMRKRQEERRAKDENNK